MVDYIICLVVVSKVSFGLNVKVDNFEKFIWRKKGC